jgi:hypothetical protein
MLSKGIMFKEILAWMEYNLKSSKSQTSGEDLADSIGLIVIMALVCAVVFM